MLSDRLICFRRCGYNDIHNLHGLKDTTICVSQAAYDNMSHLFMEECNRRNIEILIAEEAHIRTLNRPVSIYGVK